MGYQKKGADYMSRFSIIALSLFVATSLNAQGNGVRTDTNGWFPFRMTLKGLPGGIHLGEMLHHRPAGKYGPLAARGENFYFRNNTETPFRIWGVNLTTDSAIPEKKYAEKVAEHLSRLGFNMVRIHHINSKLIDPKRDDTRHLLPEMLDRIDYFIFCLKSKGIYVNFNLLTNRWDLFKEGDGVREHKLLDKKKTRTAFFFDPTLLEIQREFAREVLGRTNSYTGLVNAKDPALAVVEIANEASFFGGGETGDKSSLPPAYDADLTKLYNEYLQSRYTNTAALSKAWEGELGSGESLEEKTVARRGLKWPAGSRIRTMDTARFYVEAERRYYGTMRDFIRSLGFEGVIGGNNNWIGDLNLVSQKGTVDFTDIHGYLSHPRYKDGRPNPKDFEVLQYTAANYPEGYLPDEPRSWPNITPTHKWQFGGVEGMPLVSSEWNWVHPNISLYEGPLLVAAYASLQDLSGLYFFNHDRVWAISQDTNADFLTPQTTSFFDLHMALFALMPTAGLLYQRGDVKPSTESFKISFDEKTAIETQLRYGSGFRLGNDTEWPLAASIYAKVRKRFSENKEGGDEVPSPIAALKNPYVSQTRELVWDAGDHHSGSVTVDTPRFQAVIWGGNEGVKKITLSAVRFEQKNASSISAISLDGQPLAQSKKILLTALARMEYTGQVWTPNRKGLVEWGKLPALFEPVDGLVEINSSQATLKVIALNEHGEPSREVPVRKTERGFSFSVKEGRTLWYQIIAP